MGTIFALMIFLVVIYLAVRIHADYRKTQRVAADSIQYRSILLEYSRAVAAKDSEKIDELYTALRFHSFSLNNAVVQEDLKRIAPAHLRPQPSMRCINV